MIQKIARSEMAPTVNHMRRCRPQSPTAAQLAANGHTHHGWSKVLLLLNWLNNEVLFTP